jgi:hypothetical protein
MPQPHTETIRIRLSEHEYRALIRLSARELRPLVDQARLAIRADLCRHGLLQEGEHDGVT